MANNAGAVALDLTKTIIGEAGDVASDALSQPDRVRNVTKTKTDLGPYVLGAAALLAVVVIAKG